MTPERRTELDRYLQIAGKYFDLKLSEAMFAGAILQVAYMAVRLYSQNVAIPMDSRHLVQPSQKTAVQFCIGPLQYGIRSGPIVFAARNQYNHWDAKEPREPTKAIFNALSAAFSQNMWADMAFEVSNQTINVYANEILLIALGWTMYQKYQAELSGMLDGSPSAAVSVDA